MDGIVTGASENVNEIITIAVIVMRCLHVVHRSSAFPPMILRCGSTEKFGATRVTPMLRDVARDNAPAPVAKVDVGGPAG